MLNRCQPLVPERINVTSGNESLIGVFRHEHQEPPVFPLRPSGPIGIPQAFSIVNNFEFHRIKVQMFDSVQAILQRENICFHGMRILCWRHLHGIGIAEDAFAF